MAARIKIEPYKPLDVHTPPVPGGGYIQVDASAGKFGLSSLAKQVLDIAQGLPAVAQVTSEEVARDNEAVAKAADTRLGEIEQKLLFDPQDGYLNTQGQAAVEHSAAVLDAYGKAQERAVEAPANDDQRQMLERLAQRRLATFSAQVERHSSAERLRWHDTTSDRRIALMQADAGFHWSDDALLRRALGTVRAEVRDKAERLGWASPVTETALRQRTSRTLVSAIEAAVERDPERARSLRTRYDQHIETTDRVALDALLAEAQTRQRAQQVSAAILNSTPPDGQAPTLQWQLRQAEAIAEPGVRAATFRTLHAAAAASEARVRVLAEQVLARVLKDGLTDPSEIPVREWVALDAGRRQAIETRLDHNAAGTEPAPNPALVDELATQMTGAPSAFARRDLVPSVAHLPLPQWQRFRDLQAGVRRNDPATEDEIQAVKRGLRMATKMLPASTPDDTATNYRAELVEEIGTWHRIHGKSPNDADIAGMLKRRLPTEPYVARTLEGDPRQQPGSHQVRFGSDSTTYAPNLDLVRRVLEAFIIVEGRRAAGEAIRSLPKAVHDDPKAVAAVTGLKLADGYPSRIRRNGENVYFNPQTGRYLVRNKRGVPGYWAEFDTRGEFVGVVGDTLVQGTPRDQLSPEQVKEWTQPEIFPVGDPMEPLPGFVPTPPPKWQEGFTVVPPPPPLPGFSLPEFKVPPYLEAERDEHHHIPQFLWNPRPRRNPDWRPKYIFSTKAIDVFKGLTVYVPKGEHWGQLHAAYNREVNRHLQAYLEKKATKHKTTPEGYAGSMDTEALECFEAIKQAILNPDYEKRRTEKETKDVEFAKEFLLRTMTHQDKKS